MSTAGVSSREGSAMALATDANISKLQQMFPKVEGDVIAILLNDNENDGTRHGAPVPRLACSLGAGCALSRCPAPRVAGGSSPYRNHGLINCQYACT